MAYSYKQTGEFPSSFKVTTTGPFDTRTVLDSVDDLTDGTIDYPYVGMVVSIKGTANLYVLVEYDDQTKTYEWEEVGGSDEYISSAEPTWTTEAVGGISKGMTPESFEGKSINDMLDMILYPTIQPKIATNVTTIPYVSVSSKKGTLFEVGTNIPAKSDFNTSANRGTLSYKLSDGTTNYAGAKISDVLSINDVDTLFGTPIEEESYIVKYQSTFADGVNVQDNKGQSANNILAYNGTTIWKNKPLEYKSNTHTASTTLYGVYPIYINTSSNLSVMTKQPLVNYHVGSNIKVNTNGVETTVTGAVKIENISIGAESKENTTEKFTIEVPNTVEIVHIRKYDTNAGSYKINVDYMLDNMSTTTKNGITYNVYKRTLDKDTADGASTYQIILRKKKTGFSIKINNNSLTVNLNGSTTTYNTDTFVEVPKSTTDLSELFMNNNNFDGELNLSDLNTSKVTNMENMFAYCSKLKSIDVSKFDMRNVTNITCMFDSCSSLTSLDLSSWDTSNIQLMVDPFDACKNITELNVSNWDTSNVVDMSNLFCILWGLKTLDVSSFNTSKVEDMKYMFYSCDKLTSLDLSSFDTSKVKNMTQMFEDCLKLEILDVSNFDISNVEEKDKMFRHTSLKYIKCKQSFKDWCIENQDVIELPIKMREGGSGVWDIVKENYILVTNPESTTQDLKVTLNGDTEHHSINGGGGLEN